MSSRRFLASWLLAMAMAIGGLIPHGFMPKVDADTGLLEMVICTEHGAVTIRIGADGEPVEDAPQSEDRTKAPAKCAFAVNTVSMASISLVLHAPIERHASEALGAYDYRQNAGHDAIGALLARGPPATA